MTEEAATDTAPVQTDTAPVVDASSTQPTDTQTTEPTTTPAEEGQRAPISDSAETTDFTLPDEWKDKPWADKVKSHDDAFKQIENLTALVGKKTIAPIDYETATTEEIAAHHSSLAPENISDYAWGEGSNAEFTEPMGATFQEAGINKHQQAIVSKGFNEVISKLTEADTSEEGYFKVSEASFGENYKETVGTIEKLLKENISSDDDKAALDKLGNDHRGLVDRTVHSLATKYEERIASILKEHGVTESGSQVEGDKGVNTGVDISEVRSDIRNKMSEMGQRSHTADELQTLKNKLAATYK